MLLDEIGKVLDLEFQGQNSIEGEIKDAERV